MADRARGARGAAVEKTASTTGEGEVPYAAAD
jgi:hypothetical protein